MIRPFKQEKVDRQYRDEGFTSQFEGIVMTTAKTGEAYQDEAEVSQVLKWLGENLPRRWTGRLNGYVMKIAFKDDTAATAFKVRWG